MPIFLFFFLFFSSSSSSFFDHLPKTSSSLSLLFLYQIDLITFSSLFPTCLSPPKPKRSPSPPPVLPTTPPNTSILRQVPLSTPSSLFNPFPSTNSHPLLLSPLLLSLSRMLNLSSLVLFNQDLAKASPTSWIRRDQH